MIDRTFSAGEKFRSVRTEARKMQFLYADGTDAHIMDTESFEQIAVPETAIAEALRWVRAEQRGRRAVHRRSAVGPAAAERRRPRGHPADPGVRGDTASGGGTKPATLETGAVIQVPLFVEPGQRIRVDTRSGEYVARA